MSETVSAYQQSAFTNPQNGQAPVDADQVTANDNALRVNFNSHDADSAIHLQSSLLSARPAFGTLGRKWMTVDGSRVRVFYDTGAAWTELEYLNKTDGGTVAGAVTFSAGINANVTGDVTGNVSGNAGTATALATPRTIGISGDVTASGVAFDGTGNITISGAAITADSIVNADINSAAGIVDTKLAMISTAGKVANSATTAASANTASAIVARDGSGNFAAGTITVAGLTHTGAQITLRGVTYTLPAADGTSGQVLQTDGAGTLTWAAAAAGFVTGSGTTGKLPKFTGSAALGDSILTESGTDVGSSGTLTAATALRVGTNYATVGGVRLPNNVHIYGRNAANSADIQMFGLTAGNVIQIGPGSATVDVATSNFYISSVAYSWPGANAAGVLTNNGSGVLTWGSGGGDALTSNPLSQFAATTSAQLAGVISDETGGSGVLVFNAGPTFTGTAAFASLTATGSIAATGTGYFDMGPSGGGYKFDTTKVVGARQTGWTFTGTASTGGETTAVDLTAVPSSFAECAYGPDFDKVAKVVYALRAAMQTHGLIGT